MRGFTSEVWKKMEKNVIERYLGGGTDNTWKLIQHVGDGGHLEQLSDDVLLREMIPTIFGFQKFQEPYWVIFVFKSL